MSYASIVSKDNIPQSAPLDGRQVKNNAGGYVYQIDVWGRLDRFLILGSDSNTYYQKARALTEENAKSVAEAWSTDHVRTAARIVEVSTMGRAPKNSHAIFALAIGAMNKDVAVRQAAFGAVSAVCRTATHLFEFASIRDALGCGFGRAMKRVVADWYEGKDTDRLGYQMSKYRSRHGYSHKRMIQRARPPAKDADKGRVALYRWACEREHEVDDLPDVVNAHLNVMQTTNTRDVVDLVRRHNLTWETLPTWALKQKAVWEALLPNLNMTALIRNLSTISSHGITTPMGDAETMILERLKDKEALSSARVHPFSILQALAVYRTGYSVLGSRSWKVNQKIVDELDEAFYLSFKNVEPSGKRHLIALDVSGSMTAKIGGDVLSCREAAAAMAMATARCEEKSHFVAFCSRIVDLDISPKDRLGTVVGKTSNLSFGRTDCAAPILHALREGIKTDVFIVYTDNETWCGNVHPAQALKRYRKETGIPAKLIVVGMTSTGFSIADPNDAGMLDVVGFDSGAVSVMADFVRD